MTRDVDTTMKLWLIEGPWYTAVIRAADMLDALNMSASPSEPGNVGWATLGHERGQITAAELSVDGPAGELLAEHTG